MNENRSRMPMSYSKAGITNLPAPHQLKMQRTEILAKSKSNYQKIYQQAQPEHYPSPQD